MPAGAQCDPELPTLEAIANDLLATTPYRRRLALVRPFVGLAAYALAASLGLWWLTPVLVFLIFVAVVTVTHDVVHGSLGLSRRQTDWALFALGAILLESGHAYRSTHLRHHRVFPGPDDPEGDPARMGLLKAVLWGPVFLPRLWRWAFLRSRPGCAERRWLRAEAAWVFGFAVAGVWLARWTPAVLVYAVLAVVGSWVYPLLTVHLPHRRLRRDAVDADSYPEGKADPRPVPGADLPSRAPPLSRSPQSQPPRPVSTARSPLASGRGPAPTGAVK